MYEGLEERIATVLGTLATIANAYDKNELDDEARKFWGANNEHRNSLDPTTIELYAGRGGKRLLTLADCLEAREILLASLRR